MNRDELIEQLSNAAQSALELIPDEQRDRVAIGDLWVIWQTVETQSLLYQGVFPSITSKVGRMGKIVHFSLEEGIGSKEHPLKDLFVIKADKAQQDNLSWYIGVNLKSKEPDLKERFPGIDFKSEILGGIDCVRTQKSIAVSELGPIGLLVYKYPMEHLEWQERAVEFMR